MNSNEKLTDTKLRVVELFAGVGGFHLGLAGISSRRWRRVNQGFEIVWANQWEPPGSELRQFAFNCYRKRFGKRKNPDIFVNRNIEEVLDDVEAGKLALPKCDMLCGGFPCQDYSVARPLSQAKGIEGKKGVLWWQIYRLLKLLGDDKPRYLLLENVDRMLKSPATQRGRDFAVMLSCLAALGYAVEWRVVNAADYGFPQKRRRVYIFCERTETKWNAVERMKQTGVLTKALPIKQSDNAIFEFPIDSNPYDTSKNFSTGSKHSPFLNSGIMQGFIATTANLTADFSGTQHTLGDALISEVDIPEKFFLNTREIASWEYQKGGKKEERVNKKTGFSYVYSEGGMSFPDKTDAPSRTILTGEGGCSASRFKHVVRTESGRLRRLHPDELDVLNGFPRGWTDTGMTDTQRAFCMGNALVVGIISKIGKELATRER
jgi:DNA (cytosine-5)-methyltransferase 1